MNLKVTLLMVVTICIAPFAQAQSLSNKVFASGGSYSTASWGSLSATIGEALITTSSASGTTLMQGFQQPTSGLTGITALPKQNQYASAYPIPGHDLLNLEVNLNESATVQFKIYDLSGKEITQGVFLTDANHQTIQQIDISKMSSGMYLLILSQNEQFIQNIKIQINQ